MVRCIPILLQKDENSPEVKDVPLSVMQMFGFLKFFSQLSFNALITVTADVSQMGTILTYRVHRSAIVNNHVLGLSVDVLKYLTSIGPNMSMPIFSQGIL